MSQSAIITFLHLQITIKMIRFRTDIILTHSRSCINEGVNNIVPVKGGSDFYSHFTTTYHFRYTIMKNKNKRFFFIPFLKDLIQLWPFSIKPYRIQNSYQGNADISEYRFPHCSYTACSQYENQNFNRKGKDNVLPYDFSRLSGNFN